MPEFAAYSPRPRRDAAIVLPRGLVIRAACAADLEALARIHHEREGGDFATQRARLERELAQPSESENGLLLTAQVGEEAVGFGRTRRYEPASDAPVGTAPAGWYLMGVVVARAFRRLGIGAELTRKRMGWIASRATEAWYFANARNLVTIDLHRALGFVEITRTFSFPGVSFEGGEGILFRAALERGA